MITFLVVVYFLGAGWSADEYHRQATGEHLVTTWGKQIEKSEREAGWTYRKNINGEIEFVELPKQASK